MHHLQVAHRARAILIVPLIRHNLNVIMLCIVMKRERERERERERDRKNVCEVNEYM